MNTDHLDPAPEMPKKYRSDSQNKMCPYEEITKFYLEQINNTTKYCQECLAKHMLVHPIYNRLKHQDKIEKENNHTEKQNDIQIPPMVQVRVKTKHLKEMAVHLLQIIKGYAPEYAIPVDFGYMLYEITKEDQERNEQ